MLTEPRWRNTFTRNRPTSCSEYAKSISPVSSKRPLRSSGTMPSAIPSVSSWRERLALQPVEALRAAGSSGREPDLHVQVGALAGHELGEPAS